MELAFATRRLRTLCSDANQAAKALGQDRAAALRDRVADLRAASSPLELVAGSPELVDGVNPSVRMRLGRGTRLIVVVNHRRVPRDDNGHSDWRRIRRMRITAVAEDDADD